MRVLVDTNILLRLSERNHSHHLLALESLRRLAAAGHTFCIASQTVAEFLAVATRSIADRGLGMAQNLADAELGKLTDALEVLYDSPSVVSELRRLVVAYYVVGKSVHDTRLVATMIANGVKHILTFNQRDFTRFPEITALDPGSGAAVM
jgi:predicted nucleic acid-binding protein